NKGTIYYIVVHTVNLILLGAIGLIAFFSVFNISPNQNPTSNMVAFVTVVFLTVMWAVNYWLQVKKRKWFLPIAGTVLFVAIAYLYLELGISFLYDAFFNKPAHHTE